MSITNNTYLIIGATGGIGIDLAHILAKQKANIIISGSDNSKLDKLYNELQEISNCDHSREQLDLNNINDIEHVFNKLRTKYKRIDGLIYCAGIAPLCPSFLTKYNDMIKTFNINYFAFVEFARLFAKQTFTKDNMGHIIAISSISSTLNEKGRLSYSSSKIALETSVKLFAKELIARNICVNAIRPAIVNTELGQNYLEIIGENNVNHIQPLGYIETNEINELILYIISQKRPKTTGTIFDINGGIL